MHAYLPPYLPAYLHALIPPSLPPYLPSSLPPYLSTYLPSNGPPSPSLPSSIPPFVPIYVSLPRHYIKDEKKSYSQLRIIVKLMLTVVYYHWLNSSQIVLKSR